MNNVSDNYANGLEIRIKELEAEVNRLRGILSEFQVYGTDGCKNCEDGRITIYFKRGWCIECMNKRTEP